MNGDTVQATLEKLNKCIDTRGVKCECGGDECLCPDDVTRQIIYALKTIEQRLFKIEEKMRVEKERY